MVNGQMVKLRKMLAGRWETQISGLGQMVNIFSHLSNVYISQCSLWTEGKLIFPSVQGMSRVRTNGKGVYKGVFSYVVLQKR